MWLIPLTLCLGHVLAAVDYTGHKVVRAVPSHDRHLNYLNSLIAEFDFWKAPTYPGRAVDIRASPDKFVKLKSILESLGISFEILLEDVQKSIKESEKAGSSGISEDFDAYKNFSSIGNFLDKKKSECGNRCEIITIGHSYEGRPLRLFKISTGPGRRALWVDAGIHAREWVAWSTGLYFIERLVDDYGVDSDVDGILAAYDVYILAGQNPDGYVYTWTDDRLWRKSRQPHTRSPCVGTDINRNFDFMWNSIGTDENPCADNFPGEFAFSESEALHVANFVERMRGQLDLFLTLHSYGQLWMAPFGYTTVPVKSHHELMRVADAGAKAILRTHGLNFTTGSASHILYPSSGTSRDWAFANGIPYVFTLELRNTDTFVLPASEILPAGEETWNGFKAAVHAIMDERQSDVTS